jgi:hypothetical protein
MENCEWEFAIGNGECGIPGLIPAYLHLNLGGALLIFTFAARNLVERVKKLIS